MYAIATESNTYKLQIFASPKTDRPIHQRKHYVHKIATAVRLIVALTVLVQKRNGANTRFGGNCVADDNDVGGK